MDTLTSGVLIGTMVVGLVVCTAIHQHVKTMQSRRRERWQWAQQQIRIVEAQLKNPVIEHFPQAQRVVYHRALYIFQKIADTHPFAAKKGDALYRALLAGTPATVSPEPSSALNSEALVQAAFRLTIYLKKESIQPTKMQAEAKQAYQSVQAAMHITRLNALQASANQALEAKLWGSARNAIEQAEGIMANHPSNPPFLLPMKTAFEALNDKLQLGRAGDALSDDKSDPDADGLHRMWSNQKYSSNNA